MENLKEANKKEEYDARKREKEMLLARREKNRSVKRVTLWVALIVVLGVGAVGIAKTGNETTSEETPFLASTISANDWVKGDPASKAVLVEYSDFQCPACRAYYPLVKKINEEFAGKIAFVYRHFPLPQHANAKPAAYAAEAAGKQGKFWEMHDMIFDHQKEWSEKKNAGEIFEGYAQTLKLNLEQFRQDRDSAEVKNHVEANLKSALDARVNSTPTFFLNGKRLEPKSYEEFRNALEAAL